MHEKDSGIRLELLAEQLNEDDFFPIQNAQAIEVAEIVG